MVTEDARSVSTWNREKGLPLTELERAILLTTNWTVIVVMLSTCCPVRFVMRLGLSLSFVVVDPTYCARQTLQDNK